jgi:hypothetical protein
MSRPQGVRGKMGFRVCRLQETVKYTQRMAEHEQTRERRGVIILTVLMRGRCVVTSRRIVEMLRSSDVAIAMIVSSAAALLRCSSGMSTFRSSGYHKSTTQTMVRLAPPKEERKELGPMYAVRFGKSIGPNGASGPSPREKARLVIVWCRFRNNSRKADATACTVHTNDRSFRQYALLSLSVSVKESSSRASRFVNCEKMGVIVSARGGDSSLGRHNYSSNPGKTS